MGLLNAKAVEKLAKEAKTGFTNDGDGLYFKIRPSGSASWVYRYRLHGKQRDMGVGSYPEVSLAEARSITADMRKLARSGVDPIEDRKAREEAAEQERQRQLTPRITFDLEAEEYIASHKAGWKNAKHASQWTNTLKTYVSPIIGHLSPDEVTTDHLLKILTPIWTTKSETASRVRNRIELVLDSAKAKGHRSSENPARWRGHLDKLFPKRSKVRSVKHHPALPWQEVPSFMTLLASLDGLSFRAMEMTIITCCRTNEVLGAKWDEVDLKTGVWTIPAERMKASKDHRVPISGKLKSLLLGLPKIDNSPHLFPGQAEGKPLSNMSMLMSLRRMSFDHITMHGFRSSFRDWAGESTSHPRDVCEQALAHTLDSAVESAYRRGDLFQKRVKLMEDWCDYLYSERA